MPAAETPVAYLGIDVGKSSHSACALDAGGGVAFRAELANRPDDIDRVLERAGSGALVVVDQKRNIGALVLARAHAHGNPCAYLPGYAEKQARGMFPGIAKTDAIDAEVIARTALGVPRALRPAPEEPEGTASLRILSSQREFASSARTRAKNRLRATLLEADPALEGAVDPSSRWQVSMLAEFGGAFGAGGVVDAGGAGAAHVVVEPDVATPPAGETDRGEVPGDSADKSPADANPAVGEPTTGPTANPALKPAAATTRTTTTVTKTTVDKIPKPKAATATTAALPKTGDSNWIAASFTLLLLGLGLLGAAYRCWGVWHT